jgi:serine/threonine-protein kinase
VLAELAEIAAAAGVSAAAEPEVAPPPEAFDAPPSIGRDPWVNRSGIFERARPRLPQWRAGGSRAHARALRTHVRELGDGPRALDEQQRLEVVGARAADSGCRSDARWITADASNTREEAWALRAKVGRSRPRCRCSRRECSRRTGRDVWEGRSGFAEPTASSRRPTGGWPTSSTAGSTPARPSTKPVARPRRTSARSPGERADQELRSRLEALDKDLEARRYESHGRIAEMGRRADQLEGELLHLASRFCAPLRAKPELGQLFRELERLPA